MSTFLNDTFTDTGGTQITSHTPDGGGHWHVSPSFNRVPATALSDLVITGAGSDPNSLRCAAANRSDGYAICYHDGTPAGTDVDVTWVLWISSGHNIRIMVGLNPTTGACYYVNYDGSGTWSVNRLSNWQDPGGVAIGSPAGFGVANGSTATVKISRRVSGGNVTISIYMNGSGSALLSAVDTAPGAVYTAGGGNNLVGIAFYNFGESDSTGSHVQSISGVDVNTADPNPATALSLGMPWSDAGTTLIGGASHYPSYPFLAIPNGPYTGSVTFSDGGAGGTFTPSSLTFSGTDTAQSFTYTPPSAASGTTVSISISSGGALTDPAAGSYVVPAKTIFILGDSQSDEYYRETVTTWNSQLRAILGPTWAVHTMAVAGYTVVGASNSETADFLPAIDTYLGDSTRTDNILVQYCSTNDMVGGLDGATAYANNKTFILNRKAAAPSNLKVVNVLAVTRSGAGAGYYTAFPLFNSLHQNTDGRSTSDAIVDLAHDVRFQTAGINTTFQDGIHFTSLAYGWLADYVSSAVFMATCAAPAASGVTGAAPHIGGTLVL